MIETLTTNLFQMIRLRGYIVISLCTLFVCFSAWNHWDIHNLRGASRDGEEEVLALDGSLLDNENDEGAHYHREHFLDMSDDHLIWFVQVRP